MKTEPTTLITVDGKNVAVATLSIQMRQQVDLYDALRERLAHSVVETEAFTLAVNIKMLQIQDFIRQLVTAQEVADAEAAATTSAAATATATPKQAKTES